MAHKLKEWLDQPLRAWDIVRDLPYHGVRVRQGTGVLCVV